MATQCEYGQKCPVIKTIRDLGIKVYGITSSKYQNLANSINEMEYNFCSKSPDSCPKYLEYRQEDAKRVEFRNGIEKTILELQKITSRLSGRDNPAS
jgi:hypothetical protein